MTPHATNPRRPSGASLTAILLLILPAIASCEPISRRGPITAKASVASEESQATVLWLPANAKRNCVTTCRAAGLQHVGTAAATLCAKYTGSVWYEGVKRRNPDACLYIDDGGDTGGKIRPASAAKSFHCGCVPSGLKSASQWTRTAEATCPSGYTQAPYACRVKANGKVSYGWTDFFSKACAYHTTPAAGGKAQIGYASAPNYSRLCVPTQFAYLCNNFRISAAATQSDTKVLWLPAAPGKDCPAFCAAQGLASVNGGSEATALCAQVTASGAWYEGTKRPRPNACQVVDASTIDLSTARYKSAPVATKKGFHCGCLPRKAGTASQADAVWAEKTGACPNSYSLVDFICLAKLGAKVYLGWIDTNSQCTFYSPANGKNPVVTRTDSFQRLCAPSSFSYLC